MAKLDRKALSDVLKEIEDDSNYYSNERLWRLVKKIVAELNKLEDRIEELETP